MSGFSAEWLARREPADHRARNREVLAAAAWLFSGRDRADVLDLGCGTGSNLRGTAAALPHSQRWRLVDHDRRLLDAARDALADWADTASRDGAALVLGLGRKTIRVELVEADFSVGAAALFDPRPDLVTAAALFDLVSARWLERFTGAVAALHLPLYTVLTYDGHDRFEPPHPADVLVEAAFAEHMRRDKGFGPAAGPAAATVLADLLRAHGYRVSTGPSPWVLTCPQDGALIADLAGGIATAVAETGAVAADELEDWRTRRLATDTRLTIGHTDILAVPPSR